MPIIGLTTILSHSTQQAGFDMSRVKAFATIFVPSLNVVNT